MTNESEPSAPKAPPRTWPLFVIGLLMFLLGPALNAALLYRAYLGMPWYLPILASIGVVCLAMWAWRRAGVLRFSVLTLFTLLCGFEWLFVLVLTQTPSYAGPVQAGARFPAFATTLADGNAVTHQELEKGAPTVMVFFRGHW